MLLIGENRDLHYSRRASSWEDLKEQYRSFRIYLHTSVYPYEDGFNLALLEAMASGMPVATMKNPSSPIVDGVGGWWQKRPKNSVERYQNCANRG
jgi:glycosyltransferase involved in cell wall biosynthesis